MNRVPHGLAANPSLPASLVDRLIALADEDLASELAERGDLRHDQVVALAARDEHTARSLAFAGLLTAADVDPVARPLTALALLDTGAGRPEWARLLARHPVVRHREELASCAGLPDDVIEALAVDPALDVVHELAAFTPEPAMAARLARHPHAQVRRGVAVNEATPPAVLAALLTGEGLPAATACLVCDSKPIPYEHDPNCPDPDCTLFGGAACDGSHQSTVHDTLHGVLGNPATPPDVAARFVDHPSLLLRWSLAERPGLPPEVYARLARDPAPGVRAAVAGNPAVGDEPLRTIAADPDPAVRRALAHHPALPLDVLTTLAETTRLGSATLPRIPAASTDELRELAAGRPSVRALVAARHDLPPDLRDALAADPDAKVLRAVAPHPGLTEELLRAMVATHGVGVHARVAANPGAPGALLEELARQEPPVRRALREIAGHPNATAGALARCLGDPRAAEIAAAHPALSPSLLASLLTGPDEGLAEAAARNPALPREVMEGLVP
ncbi:hypothetical protein OHA84_05090 [Streptomyces sp. NBC_00513]|uniref:hypothetical protein n=1 Tax=unclassified Streptomyces TaxID=2593676 RepID=UPI00224FC2B9|nr:hypothetical protein [Streptomyces sp. NBC_00424]MCX5077076.1 hypothetical protein [Streptomyces sp. NBC_00424]WUD39926.1 hypothetical protein OHA84_05090 [Streptomyces sp. NBC_00513]